MTNKGDELTRKGDVINFKSMHFVLQAHLKATQAEAQIKAFKRACKYQPRFQ